MKLFSLSVEELVLASMQLKGDSYDLEFLDALIRFMEFNGRNINNRLYDLYGGDADFVAHCLNRYIQKKVGVNNFDIRLYNATIKLSKSGFLKYSGNLQFKIGREILLRQHFDSKYGVSK